MEPDQKLIPEPHPISNTFLETFKHQLIGDQSIKDFVAQHWLKIFGVILAFIFVITAGTYFYFAGAMSSKQGIVNNNNTGLTLLDRSGTPFFAFNQPKTIKYVNLDQTTLDTQHAAVASEDKDFYKNPGFSINGILRAVSVDVTSGGLHQGGSTISQELVKNALLNSNRNFLRKYQELVLAIELNRRYDKNDIMEMYLNSVYFGEGAFGIQNAAQAYFSEDAKNLDLAQSALLIGLLPAPSAYSPLSNDPAIAKRHQLQVLNKLVEQGYVTKDQADIAKNEEIKYIPTVKADINVLAPHFALYVKDQLTKKYGEERVIRSGFRVKTTLNSNWQKYAETVVHNQVSYLKFNDASNGAAVALDPKTGEILVMVGSEDWSNKEFGKTNMALAPRQPGSSFKPLVYSRAIEDKEITAASIMQDTPHDFGGYKPLDYDKRFRGPVTVRRALANSLNIPSVEIIQKIGVPSAVDQGKKLGITTLTDPSRYGLSLVLGAAEVPLLQMTSAYSVFANYGNLATPHGIIEITDKNGKSIDKFDPEIHSAIDEGAAYIISSILSDNKTRSEEFGGALTISRPAAVKTGTTENFRDALTIGYTPSLTVGVWVGNNDNTPMDNIAGSLGAAPIWRQLMEDYLAGTSVEQFRQPLDVVKKPVCPNGIPSATPTFAPNTTPAPTGVSATFIGVYDEYFLNGTEPDKSCDLPTQQPSPSPSGNPTPTPNPSETPTPTPTTQPSDTPTPSPTPTPITSFKLFPTASPQPTTNP